MSVRRVGEGVGIIGHPFVDKDSERGGDGVVRSTWRGVEEFLAIKALAIGERTKGTIGPQAAVIQVIKDLWLAIEGAAEGKRAGAGRKGETGMPFGGGGEAGLTIGKNHFELTRVEAGRRRERPLQEVRIIACEIEAIE